MTTTQTQVKGEERKVVLSNIETAEIEKIFEGAKDFRTI
jgi:hypothetical protein